MFDEICLKQSEIIESLSILCSELMNELAQYKSIEAEERRLKNIKEVMQ